MALFLPCAACAAPVGAPQPRDCAAPARLRAGAAARRREAEN